MATGSISRAAADEGTGQTSRTDLAEKQFKRREKLELALQEKLTKLKEKGDKNAENKIAKEREKLLKYNLEYEEKERTQLEKKLAEERQKLEDEINQRSIASLNKRGEELGKKMGDALNKYVPGVGKALNALGGSVEKYLSIYTQYMTSISTRIQGAGAGFTFQSINETIRKNTAFNPFIRYEDTLDKLSELVDAGIADNLVQRAFLATISDKIATTFDAAESSLLEIVRIQQRDTTAARLGMEAGLTRLFNYYFSDTSYLSNTFDAVQEAMIDLSAQLDEKTSVELEYIVQKWLGSLGSVGVSSNVLQNLAQGITFLGTGNVDALSSNQSLQNLLVMASSRAGLDYSGMLTGGITSAQANTLLASVISYVQEIAGSSNNVVKQQYAQLFGLSMADMVAFQNISNEVLDSLLQNGMTYSNTLQELNSQISQIGSRMHLSTMIDNVLDNAMASVGVSILNNTGLYSMWKAADMLESLTGGIELPFISALGTGIDLNMSLEGLIKGGIVGIGAIGTLISGIGALGRAANGGILGTFSSEGVSSLWNVGLNKGTGFSGYQNASQLSTTASSTAYVSSGSELGIQQSLSDEQRKTGEQVSGEEDSLSASETSEILKALDKNLEAILDYFEHDNMANPLSVRFADNSPFSYTGTSGLHDI